MLPAPHRLHLSRDFTEVMRAGRRAGRPTLTVHSCPAPGAVCARAGLIVSKAVGNAVTRHRVARRLRHLLATRIGGLPADTRLVLRAAPAAGTASSSVLAADLDAALLRLNPR